MWNTSKPPSVRDLAARIEARAMDVTNLRDAISALRVEIAECRNEQRALQAALEAEQAARLEAVGAIHDRIGMVAHSAQERIDHLRESANAAYDRHEDFLVVVDDVLERLQALEGQDEIDDVLARLQALKGQDEIPAETDAPAATGPVASSCDHAVSGGDTDGPLLPNRIGLYEPADPSAPDVLSGSPEAEADDPGADAPGFVPPIANGHGVTTHG